MYSLSFKTEDGRSFFFEDIPLDDGTFFMDGAEITLKKNGKYTDILIFIEGSRVSEISHYLRTNLRNFNSVIVPDSGRNYVDTMHTINLWGKKNFYARVNDFKVPLYIFNGQDNCASLCFGVIGKDYERDFMMREPHTTRALSLYTRTLSLEIKGTVPSANRAERFTESVYLVDEEENTGTPWTTILNEFCSIRREKENIELPYNESSMYPLWCSWTDWDSKDVTEEVVLENVVAGIELGIFNYIIDDGWFGPGLDCDMETVLTLGDWEPDPAKFSDLNKVTDKIRALGGKSIIWCAPHAVADGAKCRPERMKCLMKDAQGKLVYTFNGYTPLCPRCAEARRIMVQNCVRLLRDYNTDGAKYDLFNNYPLIECEAKDHIHDTDSMMHGIEMALDEIWHTVTKEKPDYIVELKQNYGGMKLSSFGTMMRAGDTPYCPDGNFYRTAYIQAYTPYALNDYQSVTDNDSISACTRMIIKMLSVGAPTYSMNLVTLSDEVKRVLRFLNFWYIDNIVKKNQFKRSALNGSLSEWLIEGEAENLYFAVNSARVLTVASKSFQLLNGSSESLLQIRGADDTVYEMELYNAFGELVEKFTTTLAAGLEISDSIALVKAVKTN